MAKNVRIKWRLKAFEELRKSPAMERDLKKRTDRMASACGGPDAGYFSRSSIGKTRARAAVIAGTYRSIKDNAVNQTMLRNLDRLR